MAFPPKWAVVVAMLVAGPSVGQPPTQPDTTGWAWTDSTGAVWARTKEWCRLYSKPSVLGISEDTLSARTKLRVLEYFAEGFFSVQIDTHTAFILDGRLPDAPELLALTNQVRLREQERMKAVAAAAAEQERAREEELRRQEAAREFAREQALIRKYGAKVGADIYARKIWIGMTSEMALDGWGDPYRRNTTVNAAGKHEQWVYGPVYLYFTDGVLTSYQYQE